ncbi:hypothetical protein COBT_001798 [Conglomerata obtusa]
MMVSIKSWTDNALEEVKNIIPVSDHIALLNNEFAECLEIVVKEEAKKFFCPEFVLQRDEPDLLGYFAAMEFEECLMEKNKNKIKKINFKIPKIGPKKIVYENLNE